MPVRSSPSIEMSMKAGMQTRSSPPGATYPREMAIALTAWLIAPAPIAWTSTRPLLRITPAMAPATATGFEVAETLSTSTGARSADIAGTPSNMFSIDSLDRRCSSGRRINGNQYRIECHWSRGHYEAVGNPGQEALDDHGLVHPDTAVPGPDHPNVGHIGGPSGQYPRVGGRDVGVRADHGAGPAVQVPPHGRLLRGGLGVHVAEDYVRLPMLGKDRVGRPQRGVRRLDEDAPDQVHHEDFVPAGVDDAPALARRGRRVVGRSEHTIQTRQLSDKILLGEDMVSSGDHVSSGALQLRRDLRGEPEAPCSVLAVDDGEVGPQLMLEAWKQGFDRVPAGVTDDIRDEQDLEVDVAHRLIFRQKKKGARSRTPFVTISRTPRPSSRAPQ